MAEIENKQDHSLLPNDYFVIVNDRNKLYKKYKARWGTEYPNEVWDEDGYLESNCDLKVTRVDSNLVDCYYTNGRFGKDSITLGCYSSILGYKHLTIDMSKVDYKRIVCNW